MSRRHLAMLLVLAALWGASFMFIKIGDRELQPITLVGFRGVALLVGGRPSGQIAAALAVVFSAICYAGAALYAGRQLGGVSPLVTALGTLTAATLVTLPIGLFQLPSHMTGWKVTASV